MTHSVSALTHRRTPRNFSSGSRGEGPCPQDFFFKIMQFSGNFKGKTPILSKFWAHARKQLHCPLTKILDLRLDLTMFAVSSSWKGTWNHFVIEDLNWRLGRGFFGRGDEAAMQLQQFWVLWVWVFWWICTHQQKSRASSDWTVMRCLVSACLACSRSFVFRAWVFSTQYTIHSVSGNCPEVCVQSAPCCVHVNGIFGFPSGFTVKANKKLGLANCVRGWETGSSAVRDNNNNDDDDGSVTQTGLKNPCRGMGWEWWWQKRFAA